MNQSRIKAAAPFRFMRRLDGKSIPRRSIAPSAIKLYTNPGSRSVAQQRTVCLGPAWLTTHCIQGEDCRMGPGRTEARLHNGSAGHEKGRA